MKDKKEMSKQIKTNAMRILDRNNTDYQAFHILSDEENIDGTLVARQNNRDTTLVHKTLVVRSSKNELYVFIIPITAELDLKKAAQATGEKKVDMLPHKELFKYTGYVKGGCSPIGMKKQYKTIIEASSKVKQKVIISAGKIGHIVEIGIDELLHILRAELKDVIK